MEWLEGLKRGLAELGIRLPEAAAPAANYVPWTLSGNLVFVAGQITLLDGELKSQGKVGEEFTVEEGYAAARLCGLNIIAQVKGRLRRRSRPGGTDRASGRVRQRWQRLSTITRRSSTAPAI